jgi:mRNA interferase RelE/StbE
MSEPRFEIRFDADAFREYQQLDHSVVEIVDKFFETLEMRADEIGKVLTNKTSSKLHGCKEIKLKKAGIRMIFRVTKETVDILRVVYILTIEKREEDKVFKIADKRFRSLKSERNTLPMIFSQSPKWNQAHRIRKDPHGPKE